MFGLFGYGLALFAFIGLAQSWFEIGLEMVSMSCRGFQEIVQMKLAMEEEKKESSVEATSSIKAKVVSCISVAGGDAMKEEESGPEKLIGFRDGKTDKGKSDIRAVKIYEPAVIYLVDPFEITSLANVKQELFVEEEPKECPTDDNSSPPSSFVCECCPKKQRNSEQNVELEIEYTSNVCRRYVT